MTTQAIPFTSLLIGGPESHEVDAIAVHERLEPILTAAQRLGEIPILGSPGWVDLADDDVRWRHSVVVGGYKWALQQWLGQDAIIQAAQELSAESDWASVASRIRNRSAYFEANPWAKRVAS